MATEDTEKEAWILINKDKVLFKNILTLRDVPIHKNSYENTCV